MDNIKDLKPAPVFDWFRHAFAPTAVFVNLTDERYTKHTEPHAPGSDLVFNLVAVNDLPKDVKGSVTVRLLDAEGVEVYKDVLQCEINEYYKTNIPYSIRLPEKSGGYLVTAEFIQDGLEAPVISRRYVKVGDKSTEYSFYDIKP
jgi:hypothetical protein